MSYLKTPKMSQLKQMQSENLRTKLSSKKNEKVSTSSEKKSIVKQQNQQKQVQNQFQKFGSALNQEQNMSNKNYSASKSKSNSQANSPYNFQVPNEQKIDNKIQGYLNQTTHSNSKNNLDDQNLGQQQQNLSGYKSNGKNNQDLQQKFKKIEINNNQNILNMNRVNKMQEGNFYKQQKDQQNLQLNKQNNLNQGQNLDLNQKSQQNQSKNLINQREETFYNFTLGDQQQQFQQNKNQQKEDLEIFQKKVEKDKNSKQMSKFSDQLRNELNYQHFSSSLNKARKLSIDKGQLYSQFRAPEIYSPTQIIRQSESAKNTPNGKLNQFKNKNLNQNKNHNQNQNLGQKNQNENQNENEKNYNQNQQNSGFFQQIYEVQSAKQGQNQFQQYFGQNENFSGNGQFNSLQLSSPIVSQRNRYYSQIKQQQQQQKQQQMIQKKKGNLIIQTDNQENKQNNNQVQNNKNNRLKIDQSNLMQEGNEFNQKNGKNQQKYCIFPKNQNNISNINLINEQIQKELENVHKQYAPGVQSNKTNQIEQLGNISQNNGNQCKNNQNLEQNQTISPAHTPRYRYKSTELKNLRLNYLNQNLEKQENGNKMNSNLDKKFQFNQFLNQSGQIIIQQQQQQQQIQSLKKQENIKQQVDQNKQKSYSVSQLVQEHNQNGKINANNTNLIQNQKKLKNSASFIEQNGGNQVNNQDFRQRQQLLQDTHRKLEINQVQQKFQSQNNGEIKSFGLQQQKRKESNKQIQQELTNFLQNHLDSINCYNKSYSVKGREVENKKNIFSTVKSKNNSEKYQNLAQNIKFSPKQNENQNLNLQNQKLLTPSTNQTNMEFSTQVKQKSGNLNSKSKFISETRSQNKGNLQEIKYDSKNNLEKKDLSNIFDQIHFNSNNNNHIQKMNGQNQFSQFKSALVEMKGNQEKIQNYKNQLDQQNQSQNQKQNQNQIQNQVEKASQIPQQKIQQQQNQQQKIKLEDQDEIQNVNCNLFAFCMRKNSLPFNINNNNNYDKKFQFLKPKKNCAPEYTLVLDLDETLISFKRTPYTTPFNFLEAVRFRPGVKHFLEEVSKFYEVIIFTAGTVAYADPILDKMDPKRKLISCRLYKHHCEQNPISQSLIKDLNKLNRDLNKTIIVDNLRQNFALHPQNGIHIPDFVGDPNDNCLQQLQIELVNIVQRKVQDVREINLNIFNSLQQFQDFKQNVENQQTEENLQQLKKHQVNKIAPQKQSVY
ncbi:HAD-like domain [Pseudocohnilembus persalinus]|uniref:HAD-like domain n=1 Tax=Pseudocohnilembus persalinus TaxID=266149 RepID=A0A0V0QIL8_PSEPJ|nr:HAD-like domain [Pseudocohnilembus persalinus]|eukprot:KRX02078.1 HAD-like domain [Pseudocohnilembus persalinus]